MRGREPADRIREAEARICELHGVRSARISLSPQGEVMEVHVVADSSRRGKELVRDIETVLRAEFDWTVDHRRISVARVGSEPLADPALSPELRVRLVSVGLQVNGHLGRAQVELSRQGLESQGSVRGNGAGDAWMRLVASAALEAAARFLPVNATLGLVGVLAMRQAGHEVILVTADFCADGEAMELVGAALVRSNSQRAVAQATLNALNRIIGRHASQPEAVIYLEPPLLGGPR